jgi:hypothetical protein
LCIKLKVNLCLGKSSANLAAVEEAKKLVVGGPPFVVAALPANGNSKALDGALKEVRKVAALTAAMFLSVDEAGKRIVGLCSVPPSLTDRLRADDWVGAVSGLMGGKGGGKSESAQASGPNTHQLPSIIQAASHYAAERLSPSTPLPNASTLSPNAPTLISTPTLLYSPSSPLSLLPRLALAYSQLQVPHFTFIFNSFLFYIPLPVSFPQSYSRLIN